MAHLRVPLLLAFFSILAQPPLNPAEQHALYRILDSVSPGTPWRRLFPDDLCSSAPHGVSCDPFSTTSHVTELSFGYVSDYTPNPPCNPNSTLSPSLLAPLPYLRKLMFYKCFSEIKTQFPDFSALRRNSSLEELIFIENPALIGFLGGKIGNLRRLRRRVCRSRAAHALEEQILRRDPDECFPEHEEAGDSRSERQCFPRSDAGINRIRSCVGEARFEPQRILRKNSRESQVLEES